MADEINKKLFDYIKNKYPDFKAIEISPKELIFEENVKMNCFYCGKYNGNWKCPPNLPDIDFPRMMSEYKNGLFTWVECSFNENNYQEVRSESSIILHRMLLDLEKQLWNLDFSTAVSFIGGSCKLCKNGCGKERCNNPYMSRSPPEATGVNIVKSAAKYGINITFPPKDYIIRLGLLLWQ